MPNPVFEGDNVYSQSEILDKRDAGSPPHVGIVTARTVGYKQDGTVVFTYARTFMVYCRGHGPWREGPDPVGDKRTERPRANCCL